MSENEVEGLKEEVQHQKREADVATWREQDECAMAAVWAHGKEPVGLLVLLLNLRFLWGVLG